MHKGIRKVLAHILVISLLTTVFPELFGNLAYARSNDIIRTVAGTGGAGSDGDGGLAIAAEVNGPRGIVFDSDGNLYISDTDGNRVRKVDHATGEIMTVAGNGTRGYSGDSGPAISAQLSEPMGLAFRAGELYIADSANSRVRKVDAMGKITTVAGTMSYGFSGDLGPATSAELQGPSGLAFDSNGNLYIADSANNRIRRVDTSGYISTVAGTGTAGYSGDGGLAASAELSHPLDVAFDGNGNLYISDMLNSSIRMIDTFGKIGTVAGLGSQGYPMDGAQADAYGLGSPCGLAFDLEGNLYVSDCLYARVYRIDTSGILTFVAGNSSSFFGGDGGLATVAGINFPNDVAIDGNGTLYIADTGNNRIRGLAPSNNANLSDLTLSSGYLAIGFDSNTTSYKAAVDPSVTSITLTPTASDADAMVTVGGTAVTSGTASGAFNLNLGSNAPIPIVVAALDGTTKTYDVTVIRDSNDTSLSGLTISSGSLSPTFSSSTHVYFDTVANGVGSVTVTPTVNASGATVTVNGSLVTSGTASNAIILDAGLNFIDIEVTAPDTVTTALYTLLVTSAASADANLSGLALSSGTLSPTFATGTTSYAASVANSVSSITITPTTSDVTATVKVDGSAVNNGMASSAVRLNVGSNVIPIVVKAQDGTTSKSYTVTVVRSASIGVGGDIITTVSNQLRNPLSVTVDTAGNIYIADSGNSRISKIDKITGTVSTVAGNGSAGYSGDGGLAISARLNGPRGVAVDGAGNVYIADTGNNRIRKVDAAGVISTLAGDGSYGYTGDGGLSTSSQLSMPYRVSTDSVGNVYFVDANNFRIRKVDKTTGIITSVVGTGSRGNGGDGGAATSAQVNFPYGLAFDGSDNLYIADNGNITVRKVDKVTGIISTVAGNGLNSYTGDGGPAISAGLYNVSGIAVDGNGNIYISDAGNAVIRKVDHATGIISTFAGNGITQGYSGDGGEATSAELWGPMGLSIDSSGNLLITESNNNLLRKVGLSHEAELNDIALSSGSLNELFASGTTSYTANVPNGTSSITVTPTVRDYTATVKVNGAVVTSGSASAAIPLSAGSNAITVLVKAEDGTTTETYTVTVTRAASSDAQLSGLTLSSGTLSPTFAAGTTSYAASVANGVSSITLTPTVNESHATVKINGTSVSSGAASGAVSLSVGNNPISVAVTAQDGTTNTYALTVNRAASPGGSRSSNADLSGLSLSSGSLSPVFASGTTSYSASVASGVNTLTVTPMASDGTATVKVNGATVTSGSASGSIGLSVGTNSITVTVTAQDGTTKTYGVTVARAGVDGDNGAPPASHGPILNDKIANVKQVRDTAQAALNSPPLKPFNDVPEERWSCQAIQVARQLGIVQGRTDGNFHGSDSITRAEFAAMVAKALNLDTTNVGAATFSDTEGHWAEPAIDALTAAGAIEGVGAGTFKPNRLITREEITAILARLMVFDQTTEKAAFSDTEHSWARLFIDQMADADIVRGLTDDKFYPNAFATREQAVIIILRMLTVCRNVDLQLVDLSE